MQTISSVALLNASDTFKYVSMYLCSAFGLPVVLVCLLCFCKEIKISVRSVIKHTWYPFRQNFTTVHDVMH